MDVFDNVVITPDVLAILITDLLWTVVCLAGVYFGQSEVREARKTFRWAIENEDERNQQLSRLHRRAAWSLLAAMFVGSSLGGLVIYSDLADLFGRASLEMDLQSLVYRAVLIGPIMGAIVYALMLLKKMRDIWGSEDMDALKKSAAIMQGQLTDLQEKGEADREQAGVDRQAAQTDQQASRDERASDKAERESAADDRAESETDREAGREHREP